MEDRKEQAPVDPYAEVFDVRGHKYDRAMRVFPFARDQEFLQLLANLDLMSMSTIYDIPAGGGYLRRFISPEADLVEFEPSADFGSGDIESIDLERLALPPRGADLVVCLAALHHVAAKQAFFATAASALKPGGWLCIGDVFAGSRISEFLDGFVGTHNGMGHDGDYLSVHENWYETVCGNGIEMIRKEVAPCPWYFENERDMVRFCRDLFGLKHVDDSELRQALHTHVGVSRQGNRVALGWELFYLQYHRPA
jgi:SAM-dependent methyltransferase